MKPIHVPRINARYWLAITLASLLGTNLGDLYAHDSGLGLPGGLGLLAALVALVFLLERQDDRPHEVYYWLVILLIRTGATNIADFLSFRAHVPPVLLGGGLIVLLGLLAWWTARRGSKAAGGGLPATNAVYWAAMLTAGVLGTVLGDDTSRAFGEGAASVGLALLLSLVLFVTRGGVAFAGAYWGTVAVARTAGTAMGDWLAENHLLNLGLPLSTLLTGSAFLAALLLGRRGQERRRQELPVGG